MKIATTIAQTLVRLCGLALVTLGLLFWTGNARDLIPLHMLLGLVLVLSLWVLAGLAARAGVPIGLVMLAVAWGLIVPALGLTQAQLLPGSAHWVIQVVHLLLGIGLLGLAENLAARAKARLAPVA